MFKAVGTIVVLYLVYCLASGSVIAKAGPGGRRINRATSARHYWITMAVYALLAIALFTVF